MDLSLNEVDRVEILTLQDNYVDLISGDDTAIVTRAKPLEGREVKNSILAEHGFSTLVTLTSGGRSRSMLFDFGFSEHGAAFNADALSIDLAGVEVLVLSHGHLDHWGGLRELVKRVGKRDIELVLHPDAFRSPRYLKMSEDLKIHFPSFSREKAEAAGVSIVETKEPRLLLSGDMLFLGEIPRRTDFEARATSFYYEQDGEERRDLIEDDSAVVANVKGTGLVVLTGCGHAGIVNTVKRARELTGVDAVFAVMGGFHLSGPEFESEIQPTTEALRDIGPRYVVPTHCTGRKAIMYVEKEMPDSFLLNMSGTRLAFSTP